MPSLLAASLLFLGILQTAIASQKVLEEPRQLAGTLTFVSGAPPLTFQYTTDRPSDGNYIGLWNAEDTQAPYSNWVAWRYAPGASGTQQLSPPSEDLECGKYRAWMLSSSDGGILAGPVDAKYGTCIKPGTTVCLDGTICSGSTPQCTVDPREPKAICCAPSQKAFYGRCWNAPNGDDIDVCLYLQKDRTVSGEVCNRTRNQYCACLTGVNWAACRCCASTQFLSGVTGQCVNK